jgi:antitoxin HicB
LRPPAHNLRCSARGALEEAKRLGIDEKEVRRLLDPHYGSKLPRIAQAIEALGRRLVIGLEATS